MKINFTADDIKSSMNVPEKRNVIYILAKGIVERYLQNKHWDKCIDDIDLNIDSIEFNED